MVVDAVVHGTSVVETYYYIMNNEKNHNESWHRSKDKKSGLSPFGVFMINKKWTMEEEFNMHILRFQQVPNEFYLVFSKLSNL